MREGRRKKEEEERRGKKCAGTPGVNSRQYCSVVDVLAISTCHGTYLITVRLSSQT